MPETFNASEKQFRSISAPCSNCGTNSIRPLLTSLILAPSPPSGTASGVVQGREENGALRPQVHEITRPGRLCPGVPLRPLRAACARRALKTPALRRYGAACGRRKRNGWSFQERRTGCVALPFTLIFKAGPRALFSRTFQWPDAAAGVAAWKAVKEGRQIQNQTNSEIYIAKLKRRSILYCGGALSI